VSDYLDRNGHPVPVKRLPAGEALGARDIARWRGRDAGAKKGLSQTDGSANTRV
jgi:hypothetical protein